jgi:prephenate dehydrogenase
MPPERSIAILGPGLLGGSLALAVKQAWPRLEVRMWGRRAEAVAEVLRLGIADFASTDAGAVVQNASLVVLATPVVVMEQVSVALQGRLAPDVVVTDVGSVKRSVVKVLEPLFASAGIPFVGSHPMAGSEQTGISAARADLFLGATCILTPTVQTQPAALARVQAFWSALGCRLLSMTVDEHDRKVARISHLPHAVAFALVRAALQDDPNAAECAGNGFRDTTRIAGSDPDLWSGILLENQAEVVVALQDAVTDLQDLLAIVRGADKEQLRHYIATAQELKRASRRKH